MAKTSSRLVIFLLAAAACATPQDQDRTDPEFRVDYIDMATDGVPHLIRGDLGRVVLGTSAETMPAALAAQLPAIAETMRIPADQLVLSRTERDQFGLTHVKYQQVKNGLPVVGGELAVHVAADGRVVSANAFVRDADVSAQPRITADAAIAAARGSMPAIELANGPAQLKYNISNSDLVLHLTWEVRVTNYRALVDDLIYVDAHTGAIVDRHPQIFTAKLRRIYDNNQQPYPGPPTTLVGTETAPPTEADALAAFNNTGKTYDCYMQLFQRDSYDGAGASLESVVNATFDFGGPPTPNNATWNSGEQKMAYGDGDGTTFSPLSHSLDVTAHELTHAVTSETAKLVYLNESGALNEGMSDITGAICEWWANNKVFTATTWLVGDEVYSPQIAGDALRYMANPTQDGDSKDYYPERILPGGPDGGGVHLNSGMPNLAFYLLSQGGKHPRNKTPAVTVPAIGIERAGQIFQKALTGGYFMMNTNFLAARTATQTVAMTLYGAAVTNAVTAAWAAVGVGAPPPADTIAPVVDIIDPVEGARLAAGFPISVTATDNIGILSVDITIDGNRVGSLNTPTSPYNFTTPADLAPGVHTIVANATDGITTSADTVHVTVIKPCVMHSECGLDEHCEMGACAPGAPPDEGGCCNVAGTTNGQLASSFLLCVGVVMMLRRRRRSAR